MAVYRFRISFEDFDEVVREIDIKSTQTFEDLHKAVHRSTGYSAEKSSSFYVSSDHWIKGDEIAYLPNQRKIDRGVALMENAKLSKFIEDPHQKFYYIYNFDRPFDFHVELIKIILTTDPNIEYPVLFKSIGEAPKIFDSTNGAAAAIAATAATPASSDFDFLNEMDFVPEDSEEIEAMDGRGITTSEKSDDADEEEDEDNDDFAEGDDFGDEEFDSKEDY
ncbi:pRiA4b ORF-3-like protein [Pedobacter westerhofensis]|uniref:PRiA4b ORF-3-like protein n=1 Tax=Pedobacter westerhofensis TaxID=425512 RepID=A0A521D7U8_9SPHI|nr:plasmid pRiA4b ORF-3 family protein [Pedobacter westerhofensis]SMO67786.1 pRiA4b ORF-3-like protein [Pedobacter westerhofensis]